MKKTILFLCLAFNLAAVLSGCLGDYQDDYKLKQSETYQPVLDESSREKCTDRVDNNKNDQIDCADPGCQEFTFCHPDTTDPKNESTLARCSDKIDNDNNGFIDCKDPMCLAFQICAPPTPATENTEAKCQDKMDNDNNGLVDCLDKSGCGSFVFCQGTVENTLALCTDQIDNDGNGSVDCQDLACKSFVKCTNTIVTCSDTAVAPELQFEITVYDHPAGKEFRSECGNPGGCPDGVIPGMVQSKLDAEGRPVFKAIDYSKLETADIVNWNPGSNPGVWTGCQGCGWWNENVATWWRPGPGIVVAKKMLTFKHIGDNVYEYNSKRFFPAGDKNYGFAVHMQRKFKYVSAGTKTQIFSFAGDDDAWVFLNGNLVIDLGGVHNPSFDFFVLGDEAERYGIKEGDDVTIDFFQAERMPSGTQAIISTSVPCQNQ